MSDTIKFIPPWEKYKAVTRLVSEGKIEEALKRPELSWLNGDLKSWVSSANSSDFDSPLIRGLDALSGVTPDNSSPEARIFQRWSEYPQIKAMLSNTGLPKEEVIAKIRTLMNEKNNLKT